MENKELKGKLKPLGLPDILEFLKMTEKTGELILTKGSLQKTLYVDNGDVRFASSNLEEERLGDILLRDGLITRKQFDESAERLGEGKRQGTVLVEMGAISPKMLWEAVRSQIKEIVYGIFDWETGDYVFVEKELESHETITVNIGITRLVVEGIRRVSNRSLFDKRLPSSEIVLEPNPESDPGIEFEEYENHVINLIDGERTVNEICDLSEIGQFETHKVLYILISIGYVNIKRGELEPQKVEKDRAEQEELQEVLKSYNKMFSYIYRYMIREMGPIADHLKQKHIESLEEGGNAHILKGLKFEEKGGFDPETFMDELGDDASRKDVIKVLNELLYKELLAIKKTLGDEHEKHVYNTIKGFKMEL